MTDTDKKEHILSFRTTFDQADDIKRQARARGISLSDHLNKLILSHCERG